MNFLALLLGLGVERALTHLLHLRAFHWLDPLFDGVLARLGRTGSVAAGIALALLALLLAMPVMYASVALSAEPHPALWFAFAIFVLLFSLGPRDLQEEVEEYCAALESGAADDAQRLAQELAGSGTGAGEAHAVERAIFVQANNRIFGVIFWFLVLGAAGPAGAWFFRVVDLMRERALMVGTPGGDVIRAARTLHGIAAWLPGRLMACGFALAGGFEGAVAAWRDSRRRGEAGVAAFFQRTEELIAAVGLGARGRWSPAEEGETRPAPAWPGRSAMGLVKRTLWLIWYPIIALLTLNNWLQ
jgi:membrane protein required for beta-lactamase induction